MTSLSRTIDEYAEMAKNEIFPAKQEKAFESIKIFRGELADYRQTLERLKKDREDNVYMPSVCTGPANEGPTLPKTLLMRLSDVANNPKPHRAPRPSAPSYSYSRESICSL